MFKRFYDSGWQHPGLAFFGAIPFVLAFALHRPFLVGWLVLFGFEILADATLTGILSPAPEYNLVSEVGIAFVILGDFRYFVLLEWCARRREDDGVRAGAGPLSAWLVALGLAFIVPVASTIPQLTLPHLFPEADPGLRMRRIFLLYEVMFFVLALVVRTFVIPRRFADKRSDLRAWVVRLTHFELAQYGLWILSDVILLATSADAGYLLRVVPNTLYYVLFVPFAWWSAPVWLRDAKRPEAAR